LLPAAASRLLPASFDQFPDVRLVAMMIDCKIIVANGGGIFDFSALCSDVVTRGVPDLRCFDLVHLGPIVYGRPFWNAPRKMF
jgi:hypothetical protein